jgi:hypothetical protein
VSTKTTGILGACLMLILIACGGGGGSSIIAGGGIGGTGKSAGTVTAFGSVFVNGTEFEIDNNTVITIDGQPKTEADLQVGFFVLVESDIGDTVANSIDFSESVRGTVEAITVSNLATLSATMTVLGQTVSVNSLSNLDGLTLPGQTPAAPNEIQVGDTVVVSGPRDAAGAIVATYVGPPSTVDLPDDTQDFQVQGPASNVTIGVGKKTLQIGGLTVDFTGAEIPDGNPVNGQLTKAEGTLDANGDLIADKVETDVGFAPTFGDEVELGGFITQFVSVANFTVGTQPVDASNAVFEDGTAADLALNVKVEVEGIIDTAGILQARKVEIKPTGDDNDIRITASVEAVAPDPADTSGATGTVTLLGIQMQVTVSTRMEDKRDDVRPFTLNQIVPGDRLETRGFKDPDGDLTASVIEREDPKDRVILQGPATTTLATSTIKILDKTIVTGPSTEFRNGAGDLVDKSTFLLEANGNLVKARWDSETIDIAVDPVDKLSIEEEN